jgi:hypothetical protein
MRQINGSKPLILKGLLMIIVSSGGLIYSIDLPQDAKKEVIFFIASFEILHLYIVTIGLLWPIDGKYDLGHTSSNEFWRAKEEAEAEG